MGRKIRDFMPSGQGRIPKRDKTLGIALLRLTGFPPTKVSGARENEVILAPAFSSAYGWSRVSFVC